MNNESKDIELYTKVSKMISLGQRVGQISWALDQTRKRYPSPEAMTFQELQLLLKAYLLLGSDLEVVYKEWQEETKKNVDLK
jgi:hypothetical protein